MTCQEFEASLDAFLASVGPAESTRPLELPERLRQAASRCPHCAGLLTDWVWLHEQLALCPRPMPAASLGDAVVARLSDPAALEGERDLVSSGTAGRGQRSRRWYALTSMVAVAASLFVAVMLLPQRSEREPVGPALVEGSTPGGTVMDLREQVRETGTAYLALAREVVDAVGLAAGGGAAKDSSSTAAARGTETKDAPAIHQVLRSSTDGVVGVGREIGTTIRPITDSAVGAFSFLWPRSTAEKPST